MSKKSLPVGIDDFKKIIESNCYFVDKSMLIDEILNKRLEVTLLSRPRRFGKTLNMSMLNYFFDIGDKENNRKLFEGLAISKTDKMQYLGEYPVIYISLKEIKVNNWDLCLNKLHLLLQNEYDKYNLILEKKRENQENAILDLSKFLYEKYGKKVIILIDEYDTPLVTAHSQGYYEEAIFFFRNFLSAALKGNPYLEFSVLTGILRVAKESIFSGLNNLSVSTILDKDFNHFGLTEEEVEELLKYYELEYELEEVKKWYNGYKFGKKLVYNPWSLINFASKDELNPYWVNTSDNTLIKQLLTKNDEKVFEELELIFKGEIIWETISENIIFDDLENINTIWSLMLFSGYLTYEDIRVSSITGLKSYSLKIPNHEIKSFFRQSFIETYTKGDVHFYGLMIEDLFLGNISLFVKKFKKMYSSAISYHDAGDSEKYYHHFMLGLLLTLGDKYIITSNRESGYGRYDIALEPKDKRNYGLIFEFKIGDKNTIEEKAKEALVQINEKKYDTSMRNNGVSKVIKIGMAFSGKDVAIESEFE
ncbi:AAA family ATPase [Candidatus Cetobacterium colombiensis]|uniref:AAA family ATPase n=1 Tax=Candidatus Cetobacterium colombiensis TaxID=3073100 RepID=A0ABU4W5W5_9FUSO|nr:AAA family ATPase [Candidatus Cetobacterium colombiensis]MDX8334920.1 AAA family ATPase [Candidatus Cetobacterium colombiensis]